MKILFAIMSSVPVVLAAFLGNYDINVLYICLFTVSLLTLIFLIFQQQSEFNGIWYKPSNVFLLSFLIVNFQYIVDICCGFKNYHDLFYPQTVNKAAVVSCIGLLSFVVGYMICKPRQVKCYEVSTDIIGTKLLSILHAFLFIGWISTANILLIISGITYLSEEKGTNSLESLFYCCTVALFVTIALNARMHPIEGFKFFFKKVSIINWTCILLYCIIRMMSGDRGPFMYMILAIFFAYILTTKSVIKLRKIIPFMVGFILLVNLIGIARMTATENSFGDRIVEAFTDFSSHDKSRFSEKTVLKATEELAISFRCNQIAVNEIDNNGHPFHYGNYTFIQLIQCIPFVPGLLRYQLNIPESELSSNVVMTDVYYGRHDLTQIGTTIIADPYFDLGIIGVILLLFFVGYCYRYIDYGICVFTPLSPVSVCILILFASMSVYIPRSTFIIQLKNLIPIMFFFYVNKIMSKTNMK